MTGWRDTALCRGADLTLFFPPKGGNSGATALRICQHCPVQAECLTDALATNDRHGVRGGLTPLQRRQLHRGRQRPATATAGLTHLERDTEIARLTRQGVTAQQIGYRFGLTSRSVTRARARARKRAA